MADTESKNPVSLGTRIPANSDAEVLFQVPHAGTIERLSVRMYIGAELAVQVVPIIRPENSGSDKLLLNLAGKDYLDGDDDTWTWDVSIPVEEGDKIGFKAVNTDSSNGYDVRMNADVDYYGGVRRVFRSLFRGGS